MTTPSRRRRVWAVTAGVFFVAFLAFLFLPLRDDSGSSERKNPVRPSIEEQPGPSVSGVGPVGVERRELVRIRAHDTVSGVAIKEADQVVLVLGASECGLFDNATIPEEFLSASSHVQVSYETAEGRQTSSYPVEDLREGNDFQVPLYSQLDVQFVGDLRSGVVESFRGGIGLLLLPGTARILAFAREKSSAVGPFSTPNTIDGAVSIWEGVMGEVRRFPAEYREEDLAYSVVSRASGSAVLRLWSELTGVAFEDVELVPGGVVIARFTPRYRPQVVGRLTNWEGTPVAGATVTVSTHLDPDVPDYTPEDTKSGLGVLSGGQPGAYSRCTKASGVTDESGEYRVTVPHGIGFAAEAGSGGSYVFNVAETPFPDQFGEVRIDLTLPEPIPANSVRIEIVRPDSSPLVGCNVELAIVDDFPYFRQFSGKLVTDSEGAAYTLGINNGDRIALFLAHEEFSVPRYIPEYRVVSGRLIRVQVPVTVLDEGQGGN